VITGAEITLDKGDHVYIKFYLEGLLTKDY
jgi:hypothetical protein